MRPPGLRGWLRLEWCVVGLLAALAAIAMILDHTTERVDRLLYDVVTRQHRHAPDPRILLVTIDQRSLDQVGSWPWPRETHARLIRTLAAGRPKAIAYDVLFVDAKPGDADIAAAGAGVPVFLPMLFNVPGMNGRAFDPVLPVAPLRQAAAGFGHVNLMSDSDGLVRRVRPFDGVPGDIWPHLMELMRVAAGGDARAPSAGRSILPVLIAFAGPPGHFPSIDAASVLRGELPPELLRDRLVIVGATAQGLGDQYPTAVNGPDSTMSGMEIQANFLDSLLHGRLIRQAGIAPQLLLALIPLLLLMLGFVRLPPKRVIALFGVLAVLILAISAGALLLARFWLPPMAALVTLAIVYPLWGWRRLAAVSNYMIHELETLRAEPDALARPSTAHGAVDIVSRQTLLLNDAISQMRDMRRFVTDSLDQLPDAIIVTEESGTVMLQNAAAIRLMAQFADGETPTVEHLLAQLHPSDDATRAEALPAADRAVPWPPTQEEHRDEMRLPDGRCFNLRISPRLAADGQRIGWIIRMSDVTAVARGRREREETLRFLSHDMRAPLNSILALLAMAKPAELEPGLGQRLKGHAGRTLELADGFIHLARAQMLKFRPRPINLGDLLQDAVDELWPQITERRITLEASGEAEEWLVMGERTLLTRALINLIDNAIKYGGDGGHVHCTLERDTVHGRPAVRCAIRDSGPGMSPEMIETLFEGFQRGAAPHARGAGLGLSFVQAVARRHGATLRCESAAGAGTTFILTLALVPEASAMAAV